MEQQQTISRSPRFFGSAYGSTMIIGGADADQLFSFCDVIEVGAHVSVMDMTESQFTYSVTKVDRAKHAKAQWLVDADCDLTLLVHDVFSMEYIVVRCDFLYHQHVKCMYELNELLIFGRIHHIIRI